MLISVICRVARASRPRLSRGKQVKIRDVPSTPNVERKFTEKWQLDIEVKQGLRI
jgi:hypothetical protein